MTRAIDRFRDRDEQIDAMRQQKIVGGNIAVAEALVDAGELVEFPPVSRLSCKAGKIVTPIFC